MIQQPFIVNPTYFMTSARIGWKEENVSWIPVKCKTILCQRFFFQRLRPESKWKIWNAQWPQGAKLGHSIWPSCSPLELNSKWLVLFIVTIFSRLFPPRIWMQELNFGEIHFQTPTCHAHNEHKYTYTDFHSICLWHLFGNNFIHFTHSAWHSFLKQTK